MKSRKLGFLPKFVSLRDNLEIQFLLTNDDGVSDESQQMDVLNAIRPYLVSRDEGKKFDHSDSTEARQLLVKLIKYQMYASKYVEDSFKNEFVNAYIYLAENEVKKMLLANVGSFYFKTDHDKEAAPRDIANDALARALNRIDKYDEKYMFSTYLKSFIYDAINEYKKVSREASSRSTSDRHAKVAAAMDNLEKKDIPISILNIKKELKNNFNTELSESVIRKAMSTIELKNSIIPFDSLTEDTSSSESANPEYQFYKNEESKALVNSLLSLNDLEQKVFNRVNGIAVHDGVITNVLDDLAKRKWESFHRSTLLLQQKGGHGELKSGAQIETERSNEDMLHILKELSVEYKKDHPELSDKESYKIMRRVYHNARRKLLESLSKNSLMKDRRKKRVVTDGSYESLYRNENEEDFLGLDDIISVIDSMNKDIDNENL